MKDIFLNPYIKYFVVTIFATVLSIFVKATSRNDRYNIFIKKDDFAVGIEFSVTALILLVTEYTSILSNPTIDSTSNDKIVALPLMLLFLFIGLFSISTLIRKKGWQNQDELKWSTGIIIPGLYGLITLIIVINWIT